MVLAAHTLDQLEGVTKLSKQNQSTRCEFSTGRFVVTAVLVAILVPSTYGQNEVLSNAPKRSSTLRDGEVQYFTTFDNTFLDSIVDASTNSNAQEWFHNHYDRAVVSAPFIDGSHNQNATDHTAWFDAGLEYKSLLAIYRCDLFGEGNEFPQYGCSTENEALFQAAQENFNWTLRDNRGQPLQIPFACNANGNCPQYVGNVTDPGFRDFWISQQAATLANGDYQGIFIDDPIPILSRAAQDGFGHSVPVRTLDETGTRINQAIWIEAVGRFVVQVADSLSEYEIWQNHSTWFAPEFNPPVGLGKTQQYASLDRVLSAGDVIQFERGLVDTNLTLDGLRNFFTLNDRVHGQGSSVAHLVGQLSGEPEDVVDRLEYGLAGYLLVSEAGDFFGTRNQNKPTEWWGGVEVNLGDEVNARQERTNRRTGGTFFYREFEDGMVFLNAPLQPDLLLRLPETFYGLDGQPVNWLALGGSEGKVLLRDNGQSLARQQIRGMLTPVPEPSTYGWPIVITICLVASRQRYKQ